MVYLHAVPEHSRDRSRNDIRTARECPSILYSVRHRSGGRNNNGTCAPAEKKTIIGEGTRVNLRLIPAPTRGPAARVILSKEARALWLNCGLLAAPDKTTELLTFT